MTTPIQQRTMAAEVTCSVLEEFAHTTKHRDYEMDDPKHVALLARKLLATQAPIVPWQHAYAYVSDDLDRLEFRSEPNGAPSDWAAKRTLPLQVYRYLIPSDEQGVREMLKQGRGAYVNFCNAMAKVVPNKDDLPLLFFLQGAKNKHLRELLSELYDGDAKVAVSEREQENLHQALCAYQEHDQEDLRQVARDVGFMLVNLPLTQIEHLGQVFITRSSGAANNDSPAMVHVDAAAATAKTDAPPSLPLQQQQQQQDKHLLRLQDNPVLAQYKAKASLPYHFSSDKALKQILVSLLVSPVHQARIAANVMGRRQRHLASLDANELRPGDWQHLLDVATAHIQHCTKQVDAIPSVRDFYDCLKTSMPQTELQSMTHGDLIQHMVTAYMPNYATLWPDTSSVTQRAIAKFLKAHPQLDEQVVQLLLAEK